MRKINLLYIILFFGIFTFSSCIKEVDFSGFIRSTDRVEDRFKQSEEWNKNHPFRTINSPVEDYKIIFTSDIHVGGPATNDNLQSLIEEISNNDFTASVFVGDLATGRENDLKNFKSMLPADSVCPSFVVTGNHELYFDGWKAFNMLFGSSTYYFSVNTPSKKDLYIGLESGGGTHGKSQIDWLKKTLKNERNKYDKCVVFTHCNFFRDHHTASTSPLNDEILLLMDLFEEYNIDFVITGHDHKRLENQLGNIKYIILDALRDDVKHASYMILQRNQNGFEYEFVAP